jgi:hypothetical protein
VVGFFKEGNVHNNQVNMYVHVALDDTWSKRFGKNFPKSPNWSLAVIASA